MWSGRNSSPQADSSPKIKVPAGWQPVSIKGVACILPVAADDEEYKIPGNFNGRVVVSPESNSLFLFGVMDAIYGDDNAEQVCKVTRKLLGGDILEGGQFETAGLKGYKGNYSVGIFLPDRTHILMIPTEDRFIIKGYIAYSEMVSGGGGDTLDIDKVKEQDEITSFTDALHVGPKPGFFGW